MWTEGVHSSGVTSFVTGQGGFLQSIVFGYGGLRIHERHLTIDPVLPPGCNQMNFTGVDYLGSNLDLTFDADLHVTRITMTGRRVGAPTLTVYVSATVSRVLELNVPVTVPMAKVTITPLT